MDVFHPKDVVLGINNEGLELWIHGDKYTKNTEPPFGVVIPRLASSHYTSNAFTILEVLEQIGVPTTNPVLSIETAEDKFKTHVALAKAGISQPNTLYSSNTLTPNQLSSVGGVEATVVAKPNTRTSGGKGVKPNVAAQALTKEMPDNTIVQKRHITEQDEDIRVVVVDGNVIAAAIEYDRSNPDLRKTTGTHKKYKELPLDSIFAKRAKEALKAVGLTSGSVDMTTEGLVFDINPCPGPYRDNLKPPLIDALISQALRLKKDNSEVQKS